MTQLPTDAGPVLTALARIAIAERLGQEMPKVPDVSWLHQLGASFVTLTLGGRLRGCIGSLEAHVPLIEDVQSNAISAAFRDPRFMPLDEDELNMVAIEVSVLSEPTELSFTDEQDALRQLRPGVDGVILAEGARKATFLPQVWDDLPDPEQFMSHLRRKAGLRFDHWSDDIQLWRYSVTAFHEDL